MTFTRQRIRHGIRHTAPAAGRRRCRTKSPTPPRAQREGQQDARHHARPPIAKADAARAAQVKEAARPRPRPRTAKPPSRGMPSPHMPANTRPSVATARSWPTAPAGDGHTQCDSMVCSTRPGRVPAVGSGLPAKRQPASLPSCHRPGRTSPGPLAARPGREGYPGRFWLMVVKYAQAAGL